MSNTLELAMRKACKLLYDQQVAFIFKVPEAMQQTPCDFFGWDIDGRAIVIECKQVKAKSLKIGNSPGIAPHQWVALKQASDCHAKSLIVWQNGSNFVILSPEEIECHREGKHIKWGFEGRQCDELSVEALVRELSEEIQT